MARWVGFLVVALLFPAASGAERAADPARANGRVAFMTWTGIATVTPGRGGVWGLRLGGDDGEPAWSPDGSRLAVAVRRPGSEGITVMDPDGWTNRLRLTFQQGDRDPAWSPDGATLAFANAGGHIALVPATGGATVELTTGPRYDAAPAWSPDGKTIAFMRYGDTGAEVWTVDVATRAEALAVRPASGPSWSPAGELAYVSAGNAYVRSGGGDRLLLENVSEEGVSWSPDGTKLLYVRFGEIRLAEATGQDIGGIAFGWAPAWQPLAAAPASCTIWGTEAADVLVGGAGDDVVCGLGGDDTVLGMDGNDLLLGGAGDDWVAGGQGYDRLYGDAGDDRLDGRDGGGDVVVGGPGYDTAQLEVADARIGVERRRYTGNLAAWRPVSSSNAAATDPAVRAVDGRIDSAWNAGGWPPQWIEVDLQAPQRIGLIRLIAGPQQAGVSQFVLGRGPATHGAYRLLREIKGPTASRQEIVLRPKTPWRGIRYLRIESQTVSYQSGAGWVSWHELEVYAPKRRTR